MSLCVAIDEFGDVLTSTNPTGGAGTWTSASVASNLLTTVSCASAKLCVALDEAGDVLTSTDPTGGPGAWTATHVDDAGWFFDVTCPTTSFCAAVDGTNVLTSSDPTGGPDAWRSVALEDPAGFVTLLGVSCATAALCTAVDDGGRVLVATDPTGGAAAWQSATVEPRTDLNAVSCPTVELCVVGDRLGQAILGTGPGFGQPAAGGTGSAPRGAGGPPQDVGSPDASRQRLVAFLRSRLTPHGRAARIGALLRHGGVALPFDAPSAGTVRVRWYRRPHGAGATRRSRPLLVAAGRRSMERRGRTRLRVRLTPAGTRLLRHSRRVRLIGSCTFTPSGGSPVTATARFTLRR